MRWSGKIVSSSERYQLERWMHLVGNEFAGLHFISGPLQVHISGKRNGHLGR